MDTITVHIAPQTTTALDGTAREHTVRIDSPQTKGGTDSGPRSLEYFLIGYGGCLISTLLAAIERRGAPITDVTAEVVGITDGRPKRFTEIEVRVSATYDDEALMRKMLTIAERGCPVTNTLKGNVELRAVLV